MPGVFNLAKQLLLVLPSHGGLCSKRLYRKMVQVGFGILPNAQGRYVQAGCMSSVERMQPKVVSVDVVHCCCVFRALQLSSNSKLVGMLRSRCYAWGWCRVWLPSSPKYFVNKVVCLRNSDLTCLHPGEPARSCHVVCRRTRRWRSRQREYSFISARHPCPRHKDKGLLGESSACFFWKTAAFFHCRAENPGTKQTLCGMLI